MSVAANPAKPSLRRFLAIDERQRIVALAQTSIGQLLIYGIALAVVSRYFDHWASVLVVTAAMAAAARPQWRNAIIFTATWTLSLLETRLGDNDFADHISVVLQQENLNNFSAHWLASGFLLLILLLTAGLLAGVKRHPKSLIARRPMVTLLTLEIVLCALTTLDLLHGLPRLMLWSLLVTLTPFIWFIPYAIVDQRSKEPSPPLLQLAVLRPFWSPTYLPFGKGAAYLRKCLPKTPDELAVTQLKGIKLLLWSTLLLALKSALTWAFSEQLNIPSVAQTLDAFLQSQPYAISLSWFALLLSATKFALQIAIWAHLFIGIARLAGYRLPRGSWRPLESRNLMDYFNRFHYYFKELLVDFFFTPTFFKVFRSHPRLRMFFATFMAAAIGNALWHFFSRYRPRRPPWPRCSA
ncbi:MAG: hypothetical protein PHV02_14275 [Rhodocyclaceae bacterium]|nr:hypothetical protein [Rhodocyclaceae bacterium]